MARRWAQAALIVVGVWAAVLGSVAEVARVHSVSMSPTLLAGDRVIVNKLAYGLRFPFGGCLLRWGGPRPGDVVVFADPQSGRRQVKRVAEADGGRVFVVGDNAALSRDSRSYGWVPRSAVLGRVVRVWR